MNNPVPVWRGCIDGGALDVQDREGFVRYCRSLDGKVVDVVVRKHTDKRTSEANRYYWSVVVAVLAEHCGYDPEEMHEALKIRFLSRSDGPLPTVRSTTSLAKEEFWDYVSRCIRLGAEIGAVVPVPGVAE